MPLHVVKCTEMFQLITKPTSTLTVHDKSNKMQIFPSLPDTLKWPYPVNGEMGLDVLLSPATQLTMTRPRMKKQRLNYRIQGHLLKSHLITKMPIVLRFVLQKILTHVKQVVRSGPAFCSCSLMKGYAEKYHFT